MRSLTSPVSNPAPIPTDAPVAWIGDPPANEDARLVREALGEDTSYGALVERVAERLFRRDLADVGASADVGFFRPFYTALARQLVAGLASTGLRIGGSA